MNPFDTQPRIFGFWLLPTRFVGALLPTPSGTIALNDAAPPGGVQVSLTSDQPGVVSVPSTVLIVEGAFAAFFQARVTPTAAAVSAAITARVGEDSWSVIFDVLPDSTQPDVISTEIGALAISSDTITPTRMINGAAAATAALAKVEPSVETAALTDARPIPAPAPTPMDGRIGAVHAQLASATTLDETGQLELAALVRALDEVVAQRMYAWVSDVEVASALLLANPPQVTAASAIRTDLEKRLHVRSLIGMLRRNTSIGNVTLGLATLVVLAGIAVAVLAPNIKPGTNIASLDLTLLALVSVAGALGSVVSVLYRIDSFDENSAAPLREYFNGLFKPIIGVGFALFVFTALSAKLTTLVQPAPGSEPYFFATLGFLAGFVEKFAPDLISKTETSIAGSATSTPAASGPKPG